MGNKQRCVICYLSRDEHIGQKHEFMTRGLSNRMLSEAPALFLDILEKYRNEKNREEWIWTTIN